MPSITVTGVKSHPVNGDSGEVGVGKVRITLSLYLQAEPVHKKGRAEAARLRKAV